jgi:hypothetical protein
MVAVIQTFLLFVLFQPFISFGAVNAPISTDTPIKLVQKKPRDAVYDEKDHPVATAATGGAGESHPLDSSSSRSSSTFHQDDTSTTISSSRNVRKNNVASIRLRVMEPPQGSFIAGTHFFVALQLITVDLELEKMVYAARDEYKVCISVDDGHYCCWSMDATIIYASVIHGSPTVVAKLYKDGNLLENTASDMVTFTTVSDPAMNVSGIEFHSQFSYSPHRGQNSSGTDDDVNDMHKGDGDNSTATSETTPEQLHAVQVTFPFVELITPSDQVSYTGSELSMETQLSPKDPKQFSEYFRNSFICFSIDMATAQSCYQVFPRDMSKEITPVITINHPLMIGLDVGFHTIEASLSHPETMELLEASRSGIQVFYMAGKDNQGAVFTAEINLRGKLHRIPIVQGGSISAQTKSICSSVVLAGQRICTETVFRHLQMVAKQVGFVLG